MRLTDIVVKALPAPATGQKTYTDDLLPGFGVRVSQGGTKTFTLIYGPARERRTIGRYPIITLADARIEAKRFLAERTLTKHHLKRISFEKALAQFVTEKTQKNRARTIRGNARLLNKHFGCLHRKYMEDITTHDITDVTDKLSDTPGTALHAFWAARVFLRWCVRRRYLAHSPIEGLEAPTKVRFRERVLTDAELLIVLRQAHAGGSYGALVELLALTGQRRGEIAALDASWIDREKRTITIPGTVAKNHREHCFPYGDRVAAVLDHLPQKGLLFPGRGTDTPFSGFSKAMAEFRTTCGIADWTLHDLRRTFATGLQRLGVRLEVTEALLNHISGTRGGIVGVYQRHSYLEEMRTAISLWERHLAALEARPELRVAA